MRRYRKSLFERIFQLTPSLPWWTNLLLAFLSLVLFYSLSSLPLPEMESIDKMGGFLITQVLKTLGYIFQFVFPPLFILASITSILKEKVRRNVYQIVQGKNEGNVDQLSWVEFEQLVTELYSRKGYKVFHTPEGPDGGVDIHLRKNGQHFIVQCKHWKRQFVGVNIIREQFGIMHALKADRAIIVTSGEFSIEAIRFAKHKPIELIDGDQLNRMLTISNPSDRTTASVAIPVGSIVIASLLIILFLANSVRNLTEKRGSEDLANSKPKTSTSIQIIPTHNRTNLNATVPHKRDTPNESRIRKEKLRRDLFAYSYKDSNGVFRTIESPEKLNSILRQGMPYYTARTLEGKRIARFLNDRNGAKMR